ncbi:MAG TPA: MBL fold metallo-hydrolase, partial [Nitrospiraceae bacterium]|nr:MBL fold metallo-hydrolase [Nitrospiraceae bacterium]
MIETDGNRVLLDCGLFQGRREETERRNRYLGFDPKEIDAVLLSHAHIDHSGALPALAKYGFSGKVFATRATADLSEIMLADSAHLQESDCQYVNRKERRTDGAFRQPLYTADDVRAIVRQFVGVRYGDVVSPMRGMKATFHDAGHILGSAAISLRITKAGGTKVILFSGDLGRRQMPILRDPQPPPPCDILIIESTYGDRTHGETAEEATQKACALIEHAIAHR